MNGILIGQSSSGLTPDDNGNINASNPILISNGISSSTTNSQNGKNDILLGKHLNSNLNNTTNCLILGDYNRTVASSTNYVMIIGNGTSSNKINSLTIDKSGNIICKSISGKPSGTIASDIYTAKNNFKNEKISFEIGGNEVAKVIQSLSLIGKFDSRQEYLESITNSLHYNTDRISFSEAKGTYPYFPIDNIVIGPTIICEDGSEYTYNTAGYDVYTIISSSRAKKINDIVRENFSNITNNESTDLYSEEISVPVYFLECSKSDGTGIFYYVDFDKNPSEYDTIVNKAYKLGELIITVTVYWEGNNAIDGDGYFGFSLSYNDKNIVNKAISVIENTNYSSLTIPQAIQLLFTKISELS